MSKTTALHDPAQKVDPREVGHKPPHSEQEKTAPPGKEAEMNPKPDHGEDSYQGLGQTQRQSRVDHGQRQRHRPGSCDCLCPRRRRRGDFVPAGGRGRCARDRALGGRGGTQSSPTARRHPRRTAVPRVDRPDLRSVRQAGHPGQQRRLSNDPRQHRRVLDRGVRSYVQDQRLCDVLALQVSRCPGCSPAA